MYIVSEKKYIGNLAIGVTDLQFFSLL